MLTHPHEFITIGSRRWCLACGSFQQLRNSTWTDTYLGPWPGYNPTLMGSHPSHLAHDHQAVLPLVPYV